MEYDMNNKGVQFKYLIDGNTHIEKMEDKFVIYYRVGLRQLELECLG